MEHLTGIVINGIFIVIAFFWGVYEGTRSTEQKQAQLTQTDWSRRLKQLHDEQERAAREAEIAPIRKEWIELANEMRSRHEREYETVSFEDVLPHLESISDEKEWNRTDDLGALAPVAVEIPPHAEVLDGRVFEKGVTEFVTPSGIHAFTEHYVREYSYSQNINRWIDITGAKTRADYERLKNEKRNEQ